jgi:hypothetical protein
MGRFSAKLNVLRARWLYHGIDRALAVNLNQVRRDGLCLEGISVRLVISWRARSVHPWDRDLPPERKAARLVEQTFTDTEVALERLFARLPEVGVIDLTVIETDTNKHGAWMRGAILRSEFETWHPSSAAMRLKLLGMKYNLVGSHFEPIDSSSSQSETHEVSTEFFEDSSQRARHTVKDDSPDTWHHGKAGPH